MLALVAVALLSACESDDTNFDEIINGGGSSNPTYVPREVAFDYSPLSEPAEEIPQFDNDYVENADFFYQVNIRYNGNTAEVSGDYGFLDISVDGAHVTVNSMVKNVEYVLSGSSSNGSFKIYSESKLKVVLDGVSLTNPHGPAINSQCGKSMYLVIADGTVNTLADGKEYVAVEAEDMKGTLFSEGQIIFSGSGTLDVTGNAKNAIASDDYILFRPGNVINVKCNGSNGVKANDGVNINGGVLNIDVATDGAKGINSEFEMNITGGRTTIITTGNAYVQENDTSSCAAIKCDSTFVMKAGKVSLKSTGNGGKGINGDKHIYVKGGDLCVVTTGKKVNASPKGIKADGEIAFTGGSVYSYSAWSDAIDAAKGFSFSQGYVSLTEQKHLFEVEY